jgi:hypothetical protein
VSYLPDSYKFRSGPGVSGVRREEHKSGNPKPRVKLHIVGTANRRISKFPVDAPIRKVILAF